MLQIEDVFIVPRGGEVGNRARLKHREFQTLEGDLLTLLNVFSSYKFQADHYSSSIKHWCSSHFLKYKALLRADQLFERLTKTLHRFGLKPAINSSYSTSSSIGRWIRHIITTKSDRFSKGEGSWSKALQLCGL